MAVGLRAVLEHPAMPVGPILRRTHGLPDCAA